MIFAISCTLGDEDADEIEDIARVMITGDISRKLGKQSRLELL